MNVGETKWTAERDALLRRMWCEDGLSASEIAAALSEPTAGPTTRNAVLGRVHRLKLKAGKLAGNRAKAATSGTSVAVGAQVRRGKGNPGQPQAAAAAERAKKRAATLADATRRRDEAHAEHEARRHVHADASTGDPWRNPWAALPGTAPVSLVVHVNSQCRWPIGDPREPGFGFCGAAVAGEGRMYCPYHDSRAYRSAPAPISHYRDHSTRPAARRHAP